MSPIFALSPTSAFYILIGLAVIWLFLQIGFLVIAARRSVLWLLGCIFLPFVSLFLIFVDADARKNFVYQVLLILVGIGVFFVAVDKEERGNVWNRGKGKAVSSVEGSTQTLADKQANIRNWQKKLESMKAALRPGDAAQKAEFDRELAEYLVELDKVKLEAASAPKPAL